MSLLHQSLVTQISPSKRLPLYSSWRQAKGVVSRVDCSHSLTTQVNSYRLTSILWIGRELV